MSVICIFFKIEKTWFFSRFFELLNTSLELSVSADRSVLHSILVHKKTISCKFVACFRNNLEIHVLHSYSFHGSYVFCRYNQLMPRPIGAIGAELTTGWVGSGHQNRENQWVGSGLTEAVSVTCNLRPITTTASLMQWMCYQCGSGRVDDFVYTTGRVGSPTQRVGSDRVQKRVTRGQQCIGVQDIA